MKTFLVSGAGSGIGQSIAQRLSKADPQNRLILLGRNENKLRTTIKMLENSSTHQVLVADLLDPLSVQKALQLVDLENMNLSGVIANAGVGGPNQYGPNDRWDQIINTNLRGTYVLIQECLPALMASKEEFKNIVIVSSILARLGVPGYSAYCASKAGLLGLMRSFAAEYASKNILVNAICPGWVDTSMSTEGLKGIAEAMGISREKAQEIEMSRVPLGKMSQPAEIASLVEYLMSGAQTSLTGQTLDINGGAIMP
jgi:NAD(P)-dependent dehydrogenase (short-subunit alcohol dehydrogenase family)